MNRHNTGRLTPIDWSKFRRGTGYTAIVVVALFLLGWAALTFYNTGPVPQLNRVGGRRLAGGQSVAFDSVQWRSGPASVRGPMIADLLRTHRFVGERVSNVPQLLGKSECYVLYDDEPCYNVELRGTKYELQFRVAHSGPVGTVLGIGLLDRSRDWGIF